MAGVVRLRVTFSRIRPNPDQADDWLTLFPTSSADQSGISDSLAPGEPGRRRGGDGASGWVGQRGAGGHDRPAPRPGHALARAGASAGRRRRGRRAASSAALLAAVAARAASKPHRSLRSRSRSAPAITRAAVRRPIESAAQQSAANSASLLSGGSSSAPLSLAPAGVGGPSQEVFPYFPLYVLDVNDGVVLFPGVTQLGQVGGSVVLQAQVSGTTVSSYHWNTTSLAGNQHHGQQHLPAFLPVGGHRCQQRRDFGHALGRRHEQSFRDLHLRFRAPLGQHRRRRWLGR